MDMRQIVSGKHIVALFVGKTQSHDGAYLFDGALSQSSLPPPSPVQTPVLKCNLEPMDVLDSKIRID